MIKQNACFCEERAERKQEKNVRMNKRETERGKLRKKAIASHISHKPIQYISWRPSLQY